MMVAACMAVLGGCRDAAVAPETTPADVQPSATIAEPVPPSFETLIDEAIAGKKTALRTDERVSASQLQMLMRLPELRTLQLDGGVASAADLVAIPDLPKLKHLRVRETAIDAAALRDIASSRYRSLEILNLPHVDFGAADAEALTEFQELQSLRIGGRRIDGEMLKVVARLPKLMHLHLIGPSLTDADLQTIGDIESLRSFYLDDCLLSDEAWVKFFERRPNIHVHIDQAHRDYDPNAHP